MSWLRVHIVLLDTASVLVTFAANWLLQSTLLITAGLVVAWLARRRGAAIQSAIYRTTLAAIVVCPLATRVLSFSGVRGWSLPMPVAWQYEELPAVASAELDGVIETSEDEAPAKSPVEQASRLLARRPPTEQARRLFYDGQEDIEPQLFPQAVPPLVPREEPGTRPEAASADSSTRAPAAEFQIRAFGFAAIAIALAWIMAAVLLMARLALACRRLHRLLRKAAPADSAVEEACRQAAVLLGVAPPKVLLSPYVISPCLVAVFCRERPPWRSVFCRERPLWRSANDGTTSTRAARNATECVPYRGSVDSSRAAILLPEVSPALPLRDVLIHELAHLRRGDAGWNLIARLTEALFFFQPLVWLLSRRLEASAEEVCDDYVVQFGGDRSQYARGLLEIAELSTTPVGATAVAMVSLRSILARRITRILDPSRSLSTRAGNLLLALVIAGGLAGATIVGFVGLGSHPPALAEPLPEAATEPQAAAAGDKHSEASEPVAKDETDQKQREPDNDLRGTVTGRDGKPVAGAKLYWIRAGGDALAPQPPRLVATAGKDGDYHFAAPAAVDPSLPASWRYRDRIAIIAPGHGFTLTSPSEIRRGMEGESDSVGTPLPAAGEPIRGRLVDINGQPVASAKVRICWFNGENDIGSGANADARDVQNSVWQTRARYLLSIVKPVQLRDVLPSATTDAAGRFELRDIGQKRLVQLLVQGDGIEATEIVARNEPGEKIVVDAKWRGPNQSDQSVTIYPNEFVHAVGPSKPVEGHVLDFDTGEPLAGAVVRAIHVQNQPAIASREHFDSLTDARGHYRVVGLPIGAGNQLAAFATGDVAYLGTAHKADSSVAAAAIEQDFRLKHGLWAEGRVYDAESGKPFTGAIGYYFFRDPDQEKANPGLSRAIADCGCSTNANGEFRIAVLPSRGILAFRYDGNASNRDGIDRFARGFGADKIAGLKDVRGSKLFGTLPTNLHPANYERVVEVPATTGQKSVRVDMPLFASRAVTVRVEAEGEGVTKFEAYGASERWGWQKHDGPEFEIEDLRAGERRKVFVFQRARNLAGGGFVEYGAKQVVRIELVKAGSVEGRLVDAGGAPLDDAAIVVDYEKLESGDNSAIWAPHTTLVASPSKIPVDKNGRFRLDGLIPGWSYHAYASAPRKINGKLDHIFIGRALKGVQVEAGEHKDLGDLLVGWDESASDDAAQNAAAAKPEEKKTLHGQVLGSNGQPFAGATVSVRLEIYDSDDPPLESTTTDAAGRFRLSFRWPEFDERIGAKPDLLVVASADGLAPDWKYLSKDQPLANVALKLDTEKRIEGRIVNSEGRPLAGIDLRVQTILRYDHDTMKLVLDDFANDRQEILRTCKSWYYGPMPNQPARITTAADGRFHVRGLAANTVIILHARGGGIRDTRFRATTATHDTIRAPVPPAEAPYGPRAGAVLFGSEFDYIAEPGRCVQGTVRDCETGRPVAKAKVLFYQPTTLGGRGLDVLTAETDAAGHYVLDGCGKDEHLALNVEPPGDAAYLPWKLRVADKPGLAPIVQDVELVKGIELRGRIVDSQTGLPLVADVSYEPLRLNKYAAALYERRANLNSRASSKPDGSFRIAVASGPGAVAVSMPRTAPRDYTTIRVSYDDVVKLFEASPSHRELAHSPDLKEGLPDALPTEQHNGWSLMSQIGEARVMLICPEEQKPPEPLEVRLVRGRSLTGRVLDAAGQPLVGATAYLDNPGIAWQVLESADFTVTALAPGEKREIAFYQAGRKLGASRVVTAADAAPLVVRLEKCGAAVGRVLDEDGAPRAGMHVWFCPARSPYSLTSLFAITAADGRFRTDELIPGGQYELMRSPPGSALGHLWLTRDQLVFTVGSAKTHDFGELVVKGPVQMVSEKRGTGPMIDDNHKSSSKKQSGPPADAEGQPNRAGDAKDASRTRPGKEKIIRGRVLLPDGKPAAGADLYWVRIASTQPRSGMKVDKRVATAADGYFQFELAPSDLPVTPVPSSLVAHKTGFGVAWQEIARDNTPRDVTLRLVEDLPIRGRVIDTEGRPVAGARVSVNGLLASRDDRLDAFLLAWKTDWRFAWTKLDRAGGLLAPLGANLGVTTDRDGRFELSGVGVERVATLDIEAAGYAFDQLQVVTRQDFDPRPYNDAARSLFPAPPAPHRGMIATLAGPEFEHVVTAELVVRGKVVSGDQKPVAGASVYLDQFGHAPIVSAITDGDGRYELHGQPRGVWVGVSVAAPQFADLLERSLQRPTTPTQSTLEIDVELKRGVVLQGRVFDRATGKGLHAGLRFVPLPDNNFVDEDESSDPTTATNDAGEFRMLVLPGPGVLIAQALDGPIVEGKLVNQYRQASFSKDDSQRVPTTVDGDNRYFTGRGNSSEFLMTENAVKFLDLKPAGGPASCDLAFDPGKTVKLTIEDRAGQPVTGALVSGIEDSGGAIRIAAPTCPILALGADRPRRVCVLHPEHRLAAAITLTGDEAGPVKLQLAASASIRGRAFAPDGQPLADALVVINYARRNASDLQHSLNLQREALKTDADGRFQADNIVPGERFSLDFKLDGTFYRAPVIPIVWERRVLSAGQDVDLGDVAVR